MLTRITARDFKAFGNSPALDLSLAGLNLFLGQNNSGKTSAADVIALFVQTARRSSGSGMQWSGELVDLGQNGEYALHYGGPSRAVQIGLEIPAPATFIEAVRQQRGAASSPYSAQTIGYQILANLSTHIYRYEFLVDGHVLARNLTEKLPGGGSRSKLEIRDTDSQTLGIIVQPSTSHANIFNPGLFIGANLNPHNDAHKLALAKLLIAQIGIPIIQDALSKQFFFVGPSRGVQKANLDERFSVPDVGRDGQYTLQVLSAIFADPQHRQAAARVREWAKVFGLSDVSSGWAGGKELHSGYVDAATDAALPLRSAGFGSQQLLPVIVQLFASPPGSLVTVEEPEISLHPAAQVDLIRMFREAVRTGRQVLITTHSQYLVMALQEAANREVPTNAISVYHFSRPKTDSTAERLPIDADGVLRGWVPSFAEVERNLLGSWMSRVHDKLKNE